MWLKCPNAFLGHSVNLSKVLLEASCFVSVFPQIHKLQQHVSSNAFWCLLAWLYTHSLLELESLSYLLYKPFEHTIALGGSWLVAEHYISSDIINWSLRDLRNIQNRDGWCHFDLKYCPISNMPNISYLNMNDLISII